jgi:glycogen operon protein
VWPGAPYPLGATWDGLGVNFALFSAHATRVELCLFDSPTATRESRRVVLPERTAMVWHGYLPEARPGQLYGYRVHGPYDPSQGHRFNPNKVVLDPYAKAIGRMVQWNNFEMFGYEVGSPQADLSYDAGTTRRWPARRRHRPALHPGADERLTPGIARDLRATGRFTPHPGIPEHMRHHEARSPTPPSST